MQSCCALSYTYLRVTLTLLVALRRVIAVGLPKTSRAMSVYAPSGCWIQAGAPVDLRNATGDNGSKHEKVWKL